MRQTVLALLDPLFAVVRRLIDRAVSPPAESNSRRICSNIYNWPKEFDEIQFVGCGQTRNTRSRAAALATHRTSQFVMSSCLDCLARAPLLVSTAHRPPRSCAGCHLMHIRPCDTFCLSNCSDLGHDSLVNQLYQTAV